ncbi:MAG: hypothetical protein RRA94_01305 [Bacteroidota bacterium]|nr:hypothetical protein [Bacteroidota bacterium]
MNAPDSVFFDKVDFNRYLPGMFSIDVEVVNRGQQAVDSLVAFPRSNERFTIIAPATKLLAVSFMPGDTVRTTFSLQVNPRSISGFDTITVSVSGLGGARGECSRAIWVEREYKPDNVVLCPATGDLSLRFVDTLARYEPEPLPIPLTIINNGDAPSKETRLLFASVEGVSLADGQSGVLNFGTLAPSERIDTVFNIKAVDRLDNTTVTLRFAVQGKGGLGEKIIESTCAFDLDIPPVRQVFFELFCESAPEIEFVDGAYQPNPFDWTVIVKNTGDSRAKNVRASIAFPDAFFLEGNATAEIEIGDMAAHSETEIRWRLRARDVYEAFRGEICVLVLDEFNRLAKCCDSVYLPSVREPELSASCLILPDTIRVDRQTGSYQPSDFLVDIGIRNSGTDPADSVYAEILITDPDVRFVAPAVARVLVSEELLPAGVENVQWRIAPLPLETSRDLTVRVRVSSANYQTVTTACTVHIEAALAPQLTCSAWTAPEDTLHYGLSTLEYDELTFTARVGNSGSIAARDMEATILLPPNISLPAAESAVKYLGHPLQTDSSWTVKWTLLPEKKRDGTLDTIRVEFRSVPHSSVCGDWIFIVGIPPVTVFTIPSHYVERYDREFTAPILIDEAQDKDIKDIEVFVRYDASELEFLGWERDETLLADNWNISAHGGNGLVSFHAVNGSAALAGAGELIRMRYRVRFGDGDDVLRWSVSPLEFDSLASTINRGSILARYYNGQAIVSGDCLWPLKASDGYVITGSPNPFNPVTRLRFRLPEALEISVRIYDALGREITVLQQGRLPAGTHDLVFDGAGFTSGTYLAVLHVHGRPVASYRLLLLR